MNISIIHRYILSIFVFIELIILTYSGYLIINNFYLQKNLHLKNAIHLNKDDYIFPDVSKENYYEPEPNHTVSQNPVVWLNKPVRYHINSDGLNTLNEYEIHKSINVFRILAIGDSYTYGFYVNTINSWPSVLESSLNKLKKCQQIKKLEVINLGVPGYDIDYVVKRSIDKGIKYTPDIVLWLIKNDDFEEYNEYMRPEIQNILHEDKLISSDPTKMSQNYLQALDRALQKQQQEVSPIKLKNKQNRMFRQLIDKYSQPIIFVTTDNLTPPKLHDWVGYRNNILLAPTIILDDKSHFPDFHPNESGHVIISDSIKEYLLKNNLVPCID